MSGCIGQRLLVMHDGRDDPRKQVESELLENRAGGVPSLPNKLNHSIIPFPSLRVDLGRGTHDDLLHSELEREKSSLGQVKGEPRGVSEDQSVGPPGDW